MVVVHNFREEGDVSVKIRIISGRKAIKRSLKHMVN
jgi:hypothetical protein